MSGNLDHSPGKIIKQLLLDLTLGTNYSADDEWPIFVDQLPEYEDMDANAIAVMNTEGTVNDRHMIDGEYSEYHGIQFIIRSSSGPVGYAKAKAILEALDKSVLRTGVTIGVSTYVVHCMNRTSDVIYLGVEKDTDYRRHTLNYTATLTMTS